MDLELSFFGDHVCWKYAPRTRKGILPFDSAHSKVVKRGIASSCLGASLRKSCLHSAQGSFEGQIERLQRAGFPLRALVEVAESLIKKIKGNRKSNSDRPTTRPVVIPYMHNVTHNLKKVAQRYNVPVAFSAPNKMARLCRQINSPQPSSDPCTTKHRNKYVECATGVVYEIPMTCGMTYVGQTGRCVNDRTREHAASTRTTPSGHLAIHCNRCSCTPAFNDTKILARYKDKVSRELHEAYAIRTRDKNCISDTSVSLSTNEFEFLKRGLSR